MEVEKTNSVKRKKFYTLVKKRLQKEFPGIKLSNIQNSFGGAQLKYRTKNLIFNKWKDVCIYYSESIDYKGNKLPINITSFEEIFNPYVKEIAINTLPSNTKFFEDFNGYEDSKDKDFFIYFMYGIIIFFLCLLGWAFSLIIRAYI